MDFVCAVITIKELEAEIERHVLASLRNPSQFAGLRPHVSIHDKKTGPKKTP